MVSKVSTIRPQGPGTKISLCCRETRTEKCLSQVLHLSLWTLLLVIESAMLNRPMPIELRPARDHDFEYCRGLYFGEMRWIIMRWIIEELRLDRTAQETSFRQQWNPAQVRVLALEGTDIGWLQAIAQDNELFVAQMFVDGPFQRRVSARR
jgi:hypothetical protein